MVLVALLFALTACAAEEEDKTKDDKRIVVVEDEAKAKDDNRIVVVAFGDSLTSGYGLPMPEEQGFAPQLQEQLNLSGLNATVINAGVAGETSAEGLARTDWMLGDKPDIVVVELGANDMLRFLPVAQMRANLDAIIAKIKQSGAKVLLAGMYASLNHDEKYRQEFAGTYKALAAKHNVLLYPFFLEGVYGNADFYNPDDPKHPNAKGIKQIATNIAPWVIKTLNRP